MTTAHVQTSLHLPALDRVLPPRAETIYQELARRVDARVAMDVAAYMAPLWRLAGNPAFEQSQQQIFDRLAAAGLSPRYDSFPNSGMGWEHVRGTLRLGGATGEVLLSRETHRVALAINSFSTGPGGAMFPLIDAGAGNSAAAYQGDEVKGAVVLVSGPLGPAWQQAVRARGAAGVISTDLARYTRPDETPDVLQWGSIPFDEALKSFAFKATPRVAARLRDELSQGPVNIHVDITNLDTIDNMSAAEMHQVAIAVGTTALFLASADGTDLEPMRRLITTAREARLATERSNHATPEILEAWRNWYGEALTSVDRLRN